MRLRKVDAALDVVLFVVSMLNGVWWSTPIMKSWGRRHGVWLGLGYQDRWSAPVTRTWLRTVLPPYLHGVGLNLSVGHNSIRIGVYNTIGNFDYDDYDDVRVDAELEALGWRSGVEEGEVIGAWTESSRTGPSVPRAPSLPSEPVSSTAPR